MFFYDYSKTGKGVNKRDPNQTPIFTFFDILHIKLGSLVKLNFLHFFVALPFFVVELFVVGIVSVPLIEFMKLNVDINSVARIDTILRFSMAYLYMAILGQGPVTAGYTCIMRKYVEERHCWLISDFFEGIRNNFKKSIVLWNVDLLVFYTFVIAFKFYNEAGFLILQYIIIGIGCIYIMMHTYIYKMIVTFELNMKNIIKNSFYLTIGKFPISSVFFLLNITIYAVIPVGIFLYVENFMLKSMLMMINFLILAPIMDFATSFYVIPMLKKYITKE